MLSVYATPTFSPNSPPNPPQSPTAFRRLLRAARVEVSFIFNAVNGGRGKD